MQTEMDFFSISNVKVSRSVIAINDTFTLSYTLKNNGSFDAYHVSAAILIDEEDFAGATIGSTKYNWAGPGPFEDTIARGKSKNFSYTVTFGESFIEQYMQWLARYPDTHAIPLTLMIGFDNKAGTVDDMDLYNFATLVDMHYDLSVEAFALERATDGVPDDEGVSVLATIKTGIAADALIYIMDRTTLRLHYAQNAVATEDSPYIDFSDQASALLEGVTDSATLITQTFDNDSDWDFLLVFTDGYEPASAHITLPQSFANVHLSGASTGGVAFGKFSAAEEGAPLFECEYPAIMSGGIRGVTNYVSEETPTGGTWIDGKPIYRQVIPFEITSANEDTAQTVGTIADFGTPISMQGFAYRGAASTKYTPLNFWYSNTNYCSTHVSDAGAIIIRLSDASTGYVILEYTKST